MAKSLVIVESPTKAKTINKYLGSDFTVKASMGHVKDLPKKELGVNLEKDFKPKYVSIPSKSKIIQELKSAAEKADAVYLAADPDREGEAICQHLRELLNGKRRKFHRVLFNEITRDAVREAFEHPGEINEKLVDAQQARRILDRLVGYQISPLLWEKVKRGISAGRVQTVALRLIVEREREIQAFKVEEYWSIDAHLAAKNPPAFDARLWKFRDQELKITDQAAAELHTKALEALKFSVSSVATKERRKYAAPPFITSTLQQEAVRKLHFSAKKAMMLAQRLYEGVELGEEGAVGLITYMRTDSKRVGEAALNAVRDYIQKTFGQAYLAADEFKLYQLIWRRFVASQMNPAVFDQTTIEIAAGEYALKATGSVEKFNGFRAVYEEGKDEKAEMAEDEELKQ